MDEAVREGTILRSVSRPSCAASTRALSYAGGPAVPGEPFAALGAVTVLEPEVERVERGVLAAGFTLAFQLGPPLLGPSALLLVHPEVLDGHPAARSAQRVDRGEQALPAPSAGKNGNSPSASHAVGRARIKPASRKACGQS